MRPGGFGLLLTQATVDELIYNEKQNEVVFVKYLDRVTGAPAPELARETDLSWESDLAASSSASAKLAVCGPATADVLDSKFGDDR